MLKKLNQMNLTVEGMHCNNCAKRVIDAVSNIDGVKKVKVDLDNHRVEVLSKEEIDHKLVTDTIDNLGYKVKEVN